MANAPIPCWPSGSATQLGECDETLPDTDYETMKRWGWGFCYARDDGSPIGEGAFYACPGHRTDFDFGDEQSREAAKERNRAAKLALGISLTP